jgi:hypothetical protein
MQERQRSNLSIPSTTGFRKKPSVCGKKPEASHPEWSATGLFEGRGLRKPPPP